MASSEPYKINQILYIVDDKSASVRSVQVVEELNKKTATGTTVTYVARYFDSSGHEKRVELSEVIGNREVFTTIKKLRDILHKKASDAVNALVENVHESAMKTFKVIDGPVEHVENGPQPVPTSNDTGGTIVRLPDGTTARVTL